MPSVFCSFFLKISGDTPDIENFQRFIGNGNENEWRSRKWGENWGLFSTSVEYVCENEGMTIIVFTFDTNWASPIPVIKGMGEKFPAIEFELGALGDGIPQKVCDVFVMEKGKETTNVGFSNYNKGDDLCF